jgi:hypothetical protein
MFAFRARERYSGVCLSPTFRRQHGWDPGNGQIAEAPPGLMGQGRLDK